MRNVLQTIGAMLLLLSVLSAPVANTGCDSLSPCSEAECSLTRSCCEGLTCNENGSCVKVP
jgi:hypothetical protein